MSFILDALKKSESERHRHSGPVLMDVRIAAPRRRLPVWAWVIAGVLLVNLLVLGWVLWHAPDHHADTATVAAVPATAAPPVAAPSPAALPAVATNAAPTTAQQITGAPTAAPQVGAPAVSPTPPQAFPPGANAVPPVAATVTAPTADAPIIDTTNLPRVQDLIAAGTALPELRLSLHVFDAAPANRYVLLNGARMREGELTQEGVKVLQIAPAGVVLEWRGRRMFLSAAG